MDGQTGPFSIPITIIAGFLGAGKTTLLNRILHAEHGLRIAVLVNDFGKIDIDARLLAAAQPGQMVSLPNGCICCTLFGNLVKVVQDLIETPQPPEHIIIEASGVSSPADVAAILEIPALQNFVTLDSIITMIDAENVRRLARVVVFLEGQIRSADTLLVNKTDLVDADTLAEVLDWIRAIAPEARILKTSYAQVPLELILGVGRPIPFGASPHPALHADHDQLYETWSYTTSKPLLKAALQTALEGLPRSIYRGKGFVYLADSPEQRYILQLVGKRVRLDGDQVWGTQPPQTELVFIGEPGALDPAKLQANLDRCLVENLEPDITAQPSCHFEAVRPRNPYRAASASEISPFGRNDMAE
ncbi:MAG: GTP-binding protein [Anaerolineales bacterium]|nr:GTP-binding protein [Anaerolineales bacterium]